MEEKSSNSTKLIIVFAVGLLLGFVVGFALANGVNRQEQDKLRAELTRVHSGGTSNDSNAGAQKTNAAGAQKPNDAVGGDDSIPTLTDEQLKNAVAKADASPTDAELQKKVGQALYVYAWEKGNDSILPEVARILKRAHDLDPRDFKTALMAGDALFLVARSGGDARRLADARKLYQDALASKPDDAESRTKLGMTYFYDSPSDPQQAIREYRRALQSDPRQEIALQALAAALVETGSLDEAAKQLDQLEKVNPSNQQLAGLRAQLEQRRNAAKESK
jgi:tetratricopeptide (TPR) repeat protein